MAWRFDSRQMWAGTLLVATIAGAAVQTRSLATPTQNAAPPATGVIAGRVVDAVTGRPVAGAQVSLRQYSTGARPTMTSATSHTAGDGMFRFENLPEGQFTFSVVAEGYLVGGSGRYRPGEPGVAFELRAGERLTDFVSKLWQSGTISGIVTDDLGEPVVRARVHPLQVRYLGGERVWVDIGPLGTSKATDDRGAFRLTDLQPADYVVMVPASNSNAARGRSGGPPHAAGFSGGSRTIADAQVVSLSSGEHRPGVDVRVTTPTSGSGRFPVSGRVAAGAPLVGPLTLRLIPDSIPAARAGFEELTTTASADGVFTFAAVQAGQYRIQTWQFPELPTGGLYLDATSSNRLAVMRTGAPLLSVPEGPTRVGDLPVSVDRPIAGVVVPMQAAARITGRVVFESDAYRPTADELLKVAILPASAFGRSLGAVPGGRLEADGRFTTVGLPPGQYVLQVHADDVGGARDWSTDTVTSGARSYIGRPIDLGTSDLEVTITMTDRFGTVRGTVRDAGGAARPDARVIQFARDPDKRGDGLAYAPNCVEAYPPDPSGRYGLLARPSCDSLVVAVLNPPRLWMAPDYLESLVPFAVPANVALGETRTIDLVARP